MQTNHLEDLIQQETLRNGGRLKLDFQNTNHYRFYINRLGGEDTIRETSPGLFQLLQMSRTPVEPEDDEKVFTGFIALEDMALIENPHIIEKVQPQGKESQPSKLVCSVLRTSYGAGNVSLVTADTRVIDIDTQQCITRDTYLIDGDPNGEFIQNVELELPAEQYALGHAYRQSSLFTEFIQNDQKGIHLGATNVVSITFTGKITDYIKKMVLTHPVIRYAENREGELKNYICISYSRDCELKSPDYSYKVDLNHWIYDIPICLPFYLTVELTEDASFHSVNNSYFDNNWDPQIYVKNFDNEEKVPISSGAAPFIADWRSFSIHNVKTERDPSTQMVNKLTLFFQKDETIPPVIETEQDRWPSILFSHRILYVSTYGQFYMNIAFNVAIKKGPITIDNTLPVIIQYLKGEEPCNETGPGINNLYIPPLFYQWGCLAKDTLVITDHGPKAAERIQIGDSLLTRENSFAVVRDIITGPEQELLNICLENQSSIRLTKDHTLCYESGKPVAASEIRPGDRIQIFSPETGLLAAAAVVSCRIVAYGDTVYNFSFDTPTFIIAEGIVAGDDKYQQKIRPAGAAPFLKKEPSQPVKKIAQDILLLLDGNNEKPETMSYPDFISCNEPTHTMLYYYAVKALAGSSGLYTETEAQTIAQYCAFLESNATYGGVHVDRIDNEKVIARGLYLLAEDGFYVKLIPTATEKWYDDQELDMTKTWTCPNPPVPGEKDTFSYHVIDDILFPFHYPVADKKAVPIKPVVYDPPFLEMLLDDILAQSKSSEPVKMKYLLMGMGMAFHLLIDSLLHEHYTGKRYWQNLRRVQDAFDYTHYNQAGAYKPYKNYPYEPYSASGNYPAGIQQTGAFPELPFVLFNYLFPVSTTDLTTEPETLSYSGYKTFVNNTRLLPVFHQIQAFLFRFKGKTLDDLNWHDQYEAPLDDIFKTPFAGKEEWAYKWHGQFPNVAFSYDAKAVYENLVKGTEEEGTASYEDLFQFILMLNQIQLGGNLYD